MASATQLAVESRFRKKQVFELFFLNSIVQILTYHTSGESDEPLV